MPKSVNVWIGENDFLIKSKIKTWKDLFVSKYPSAAVMTASVSDPDWQEKWDMIRQNLRGSGLFSSKRLAVVDITAKARTKEEEGEEEIGANYQEELLNLIPLLDTDAVLIVWSSNPDKRQKFWKTMEKLAIEQAVTLEDFPPFDNTSFSKWAVSEAKKLGFDLLAPDSLGERVGYDGWWARTELEKMSVLHLGKQVTIKEVDELVEEQADDNVFHFVEAVAHQQTAKALELLREQLREDELGLRTLAMVVWQFRAVLQAKDYIQHGENPRMLASSLGLKPFVAQKALAITNKYSWEDLKKIYQGLYEIELGRKTGKMEVGTGLIRMITKG
ncbi:MAG: DNA polymerase III subunit delta [bacterium]